MLALLHYLLPWDFSPTVLSVSLLSGVTYARGVALLRQHGQAPGAWRSVAFFAGLGLDYAALQTYVDYLSQHMFWVHRLQHLILHHIAPILLVAATPGSALKGGPPAWLRDREFEPMARQRTFAGLLRYIQSPVVALVLFVGLVYYWLTPSVHFAAMLDADRYLLMNW